LTPKKEIKMNVWSFVVHRIKAIELICSLGSWRRGIFELKLPCASVKVLKSYFNPWMSNNEDVHTIESILLVFFMTILLLKTYLVKVFNTDFVHWRFSTIRIDFFFLFSINIFKIFLKSNYIFAMFIKNLPKILEKIPYL
jgi:hypothetical protein